MDQVSFEYQRPDFSCAEPEALSPQQAVQRVLDHDWDEQFARDSRYGGIVAPQSFTVCMDYGHGCHPAGIGNIPGSHLIFGGEEWWFYGAPIRPGDKLTQDRRFDGYSVADTQFAGPTVFCRGDTVHRNQHGVPVAKERATSIRYLVEEAKKRGIILARTSNPKLPG